MISRRFFTLTAPLAAGAAWLSGCVGGSAPVAGSGSRETPPPRPVANPGWDAWVEGYRSRASARGISAPTLNAAFQGAGFLPDVIEKDRNQTEFKRSLEDYLSIAASDERVSLGRQMYARHGATLAAIEARYGVEGHVVAAFWGLESFFGTRRGNVPVISALSTLAYDGRRGAFFESQLDGALRILQAGDIPPARMVGSWAGAMGHTQFIPTSYLEYAVDFTGDGRRDIWSDDPTDALASTANYVRRSGWQKGLPWGMEVSLPGGFNPGLLGRGKGKSAAEWNALGVTRAGGGALAVGGSIIAPGGVGTPAFLLTQNFNVILRYNNAENYAIGVGHLSDRILGGGPVRAAFGPDATGLTKADRQELQRRLTAAGFDTGGTDGVIGPKSREAITAFQRSRGMAATGEPSPALLAALR
ncbi:lytic murein transglycosylase [Pseudogemmobacter humi]|uniref:Membrane-bound lytic murein transglycosylase B n=1 Tax=Pseudogemmobacter humi TaxID=2483812 RepID=A0A3P5XAS3_9RHOB|nr:lytic murein transglycosylase [Pseudogemmobacter humi]VDC31746.1 Membrane-bound lytic murein transglycosylase B precursor [Pseudogemmobacter humi]